MTKKWTYPRGAIVKDKDGNTVITIATRLYKIGVYIIQTITDTGSYDQGGYTPLNIKKIMACWKQDNLQDGYTIEFSRNITVTTDKDGFYIEI